MKEHLSLIKDQFTKRDIESIADQIVTDYVEHGTNIMKVAEQMAKIDLLIKQIKGDSRYISYIREELQKHGNKFKSEYGTKIDSCEVGYKWDWASTNDHKVYELQKEHERITKLLKEREEFLKALPKDGIEIHDGDGVLYTIYPPAQTSVSSYKVTIPSK